MTPTTVRFRDVRQNPDYAASHGVSEWTLPGMKRTLCEMAGETVAIYLPPVPPHDHWRCGIERVWCVPDDEVERLVGTRPPFGHVYVCEHQVEID